jgi:hypothetical protein
MDPHLQVAGTSFVAFLDAATLLVLSLVPLAAPLGLTDVDVPPSAIMGWFLLAAPLVLAEASLLGAVFDIARFHSPVHAQISFGSCALACILASSMAVQAEFAVGEDIAGMRGFAMAAAALFAMNMLVLWRRAFEPDASM